MSKMGIKTISARRLFWAKAPYVTVKINDNTMPASMRRVVRRA